MPEISKQEHAEIVRELEAAGWSSEEVPMTLSGLVGPKPRSRMHHSQDYPGVRIYTSWGQLSGIRACVLPKEYPERLGRNINEILGWVKELKR